jgi:glutaconyl-CoA/methylmalonyl-CoA decarboxylase subunit gamma
MPIYRVTVDGRDYKVEIPDPDGRPVQAIVDGYAFEVDVEPADWIEGVREAGALPERPAAFEPPSKAPLAHTSSVGGGSAGERQQAGDGKEMTVAAPLPGTIVSISVSEGDRVGHGDELCVLEAMKMNNPIRATASGLVKEVLVGVGQQVQHGHALLVLVEV